MQVIARITDGSRFHEFKAEYAKTIVTGFCRIHRYVWLFVAVLGVIINRNKLHPYDLLFYISSYHGYRIIMA